MKGAPQILIQVYDWQFFKMYIIGQVIFRVINMLMF